jgi:hypothetical protein
MRTGNMVGHLNVQAIFIRFRIRAATVRAAHVRRKPTGINRPADPRKAPYIDPQGDPGDINIRQHKNRHLSLDVELNFGR